MNLENLVYARAKSQCELCCATTDLTVYEVSGRGEKTQETCALLCGICLSQIEHNEQINANHWHCLNDSMWSEYPVIQVLSWRVLNLLRGQTWALNLLDQLYLDEENLHWAKSGLSEITTTKALTKDSNGAELVEGDSVTLIKDLDVKGANFTAKRGTLVKNIRLTDDTGLIEGKVNGTMIVLKTCFLKKV